MSAAARFEGVARGIAATRKFVKQRFGDRSWMTAIDTVIAGLEELNGSTEKEFLAVGGRLMEFRVASRQISQDMSTLMELISGEQGQKAFVALDGVLEESRNLGVCIEESGRALSEVHDLAGRLRRTFTELPATVSTFRTLCTLTRIETSSMGNETEGFSNLADEVRPLSESIQTSGEGVLRAVAVLDSDVRAALETAAGLRTRQLRGLPALIRAVTASMHTFAERQQRAREASERHRAEYVAVTAAVDDLVRAIQFHDITRQQVEHVAQALRHVREGNGDGPSILRVQEQQLRSAMEKFTGAVTGIEHDLDAITGRLQEMANTSRTLMGVSEADHSSFFLGMEQCFTEILKTVNDCMAAQAEIRATAEGMETRALAMDASIAAIASVEIQIQRIALNAAIRSAHLGGKGEPLAVIAEAMRNLIEACIGNTEEAVRVMEETRAAAHHLAGGGGAGTRCGELQNMRDAILEMHSASELSFSRVAQIAQLGARLAENIGSVRRLSVGALFREVTERACEEIARIASEMPQSRGNGSLDVLAGSYTMQTEREVHQAVVEGAHAPEAEPVAVGAAADELDDNVEFF